LAWRAELPARPCPSSAPIPIGCCRARLRCRRDRRLSEGRRDLTGTGFYPFLTADLFAMQIIVDTSAKQAEINQLGFTVSAPPGARRSLCRKIWCPRVVNSVCTGEGCVGDGAAYPQAVVFFAE
jgi:hypothetical protein